MAGFFGDQRQQHPAQCAVVEQAAAASPAMAVTASTRLAAFPAGTEIGAAPAAHVSAESMAEPAMTTVFFAASVAASLKDPLGPHDRFLFDISIHGG
ncbi:hypothetical protein BREVUG8_60162 [Brevundimonas sp. G8]|nr:hypothetical protein BREVUG8_60162 [Brevundimonas sp. G8]